MRWLGAALCWAVMISGCGGTSGPEVSSTTLPLAGQTSTSPSTTTTSSTSTTSTTTTTRPPTTTTTLHPIVQTLAGSWRARSWNPRVDGWVDLHLTDAGLFQLTNPQFNDIALASGRFEFSEDTVTVHLGLFVWPGCDGSSVFTWNLDETDTLRFTVIEEGCRNVVEALVTHPWSRRD